MNFLTNEIKPMYFKYLAAAFGSALISSIYSIVDMAMVGQYQGPDGTAALAIVSPIWNIIYSLGLLMGIGGSVLFSTIRGSSDKNRDRANQYFTASLIGVIILSVIVWILVAFFDEALLILFGAEETLLPLAKEYILPIKFVAPSFLINQFLSAYLRNDNNPTLATKAVLYGGIFNIFGDYFFVFTLDMGIFGAGLATAIGSMITLIMLLTHFRSDKNTIKVIHTDRIPKLISKICITGFSTFFVDVAMGILTMLFNRQILVYFSTNELSIYAIIINISTIVTCFAYSIGQAAQPIISSNFGARKMDRIRETLKYALMTSFAFGLIWLLLAELFPIIFVRIFMTPTDTILNIAPGIIRTYGLSFLLLPLNVFSTYYFQALMKPKISFLVSVSRGVIISSLALYLLPIILPGALWLTMPVTELIVAIYVIIMMIKYTKTLENQKAAL